jgi:hypothetical protein
MHVGPSYACNGRDKALSGGSYPLCSQDSTNIKTQAYNDAPNENRKTLLHFLSSHGTRLRLRGLYQTIALWIKTENSDSLQWILRVWRWVRILASRKGRQKGNPVSGGITGPPCSWGIQIRKPGPPGWGSLRWDSKIWSSVLWNFGSRVIVLARPRSNCTVNYRPVLSSERALQNNKPATVGRKFQGERKIGRGSQKGAWHQDRLADWLSVVNFNFNFITVEFPYNRGPHRVACWVLFVAFLAARKGRVDCS